MKKILTVFAMTILMAAIAPQTRATAYWGTVVAPTGQTLYWSLVGGDRIAIVCPGIGPYFPWSMYGTDYQKPTGALVIPDSVDYNGNAYPVKYIYKYAFSGCDSLTSVVIQAFCRCTSLVSVTFNDSLKYIYDSAFAECSSLPSVTIPEAVVLLGLRSFAMCTSLTTIVFNAENCLYSGGGNNDYSPFYNCVNVTHFTSGNRVKRIPAFFCHRMSHLSSIILGDSVTYIGREAFIGDSLTTITIPASVTYIGERAFSTNFRLDTVYMMPLTPPELGANAFYAEASGRSARIPVPDTSHCAPTGPIG